MGTSRRDSTDVERKRFLLKRLAGLRLRKAEIEDEEDFDEDFVRELQEQLEDEDLREELEQELETDETTKDLEEQDLETWMLAAQDPEGPAHEFFYENYPEYREWYNNLVEQQAQTPSEAEEEVEETREEVKQDEEEDDEQRLANFNDTLAKSDEILSGFLNLSEEELEALHTEETTLTQEQLEQEEAILTKDDLIKSENPYETFVELNSEYKHIIDGLTNHDSLDSNRLARAFFGYVPASLVRDFYNIGVEQNDEDYSRRIGKQIENLSAFDDLMPETFDERVRQLSDSDAEKYKQGVTHLNDIRETAASLLEDTQTLVSNVDGDVTSNRFKVVANKLIEHTKRQLQQLETLRRSFPETAEYGVELDNLAAPLVNSLTNLQQFLVYPEATSKTPAVTFLSWHDRANKGDKRFDQLFGMIMYYVQRACARQLYYYPQIAKAPGVEGANNVEAARNLMTAVLYGLNLHHVEATQREEEALRSTDYYAGYSLDELLDNPVMREKALEELVPLQQQQMKNLLKKRERARSKVNLKDSVLHKIHQHLTQTSKNTPVCPKCNSSWWSFQSAAFPNASGEIFNTNILPRLANQPEEVREELSKVKDSIHYEWRDNPFKAPEGIYLGKEGRLCGGIHDGANVDEAIVKLENAHNNLQHLAKQKQKQVSEYQTGDGYPEGYFDGPFVEEDLRKGIVTLDKNQIAEFWLPDTSDQEVQSNISAMNEALETNAKVKPFEYRKRKFLISKQDLNALRDELEGVFCFHSKKQVQQSLAQLINVAVKSSTLKGMKTLPAYAGQRVVNWTCPSCSTVNRVPVDIGVVSRKGKTKEFSNVGVICENPTCDDRYHILGETKTEQREFRKPAPQSIDYQIDEDGGSIADTLAAPEVGQEALFVIDEITQEHREQRDTLIERLNQYGANNTWTIKLDQRTRGGKVEISLPQLGEALMETLDVIDLGEALEADGSTALNKIDEKTLTVAHRFGFVFPFAVCQTCNTVHPQPVSRGSIPRCIHVENIKVAKKLPMNDVARIYKGVLRTDPDFPRVHIPDFERWRDLWNQQFRTAAKSGLIRKAAVDPDDEDDFDLLDSLEDILSDDVEKKEKTPQEDPFATLFEDVEEVSEKKEEEEAFSEDDFFEAAFGEEDASFVDEEAEEQLEEDTEATSPEPELEAQDEDDLLSIYEQGLEQPDRQRPEDVFEVQLLDQALQVLPSSERQKIWGSNMEIYRAGTAIDQIPEDVRDKVLEMYNIKALIAVVDNPLDAVNSILDDAKTQLIQLAKDLSDNS